MTIKSDKPYKSEYQRFDPKIIILKVTSKSKKEDF